MFIFQINGTDTTAAAGTQDTGATPDTQTTDTTTAQPSEVEVLRSQLLEKDREIQVREQALYERNIELQTYQRLFAENKAAGMTDRQAHDQAATDVGTETTDGYVTNTGLRDTLGQLLDEREQKQAEEQKQEYVDTFVQQKVTEGAIDLLNSKFEFNGTFSDADKKAIFQDRLPQMIGLVKNRYPTLEGAFKRAFFGLVRPKSSTGANTQTSTTTGLADTGTQVAGSPGGGAADLVKTQELERAKVALEKKEISFRDYLSKYRAVHGDKHTQVSNSF